MCEVCHCVREIEVYEKKICRGKEKHEEKKLNEFAGKNIEEGVTNMTTKLVD